MKSDGPDAVGSPHSDDNNGTDGDHTDAIAADVIAHAEPHNDDYDAAESHDAAPPIMGLIRRAARDDRPRRSVAYLHTEPYELVVDRKSGFEYEVRACKYCDTAFSFKGGTTSSALRHLRLAHSPQVYGVPAVHATPQIPVPVPVLAPVSVPAPSPIPTPPHQLQHPQEESLPQSQPSPEEGVATGGATVPAEDPMPVEQERQPAQDALEDEPDERPTSTPPRNVFYKRRRGEEEPSHGGVHRGFDLTVNQVAVAHFIAHYKHVLPPRKRFAFVKHLTYNDREAAMYNVLDDEMRLAFLAQFNDSHVE